MNKSGGVSPILRRVFSKNTLYVQGPSVAMGGRPESRVGEKSVSSGGKHELTIDVTTEENVQFMDQPLRGRIDLSGLTAPVENVVVSLRGVVKVCVAGNAAWASGFGGDSNVMARFTEKEILKQEFTLHPCTQPATPLSPDKSHTLPFVFLFPGSANLPPSMVFPQGLGSVEYTLNVLLKGKRKFGSAKKWNSTLVLKVEVSRKAIGARLEQMAIADSAIGKTKHIIMLEHPRIILPGYANHYFTLHFPQGLLQVHTFEATLVQRSFYKALGGNYRGASMVGLVCRVGQSETNVREAGMERVHVEIAEVGDEGLESSVEVDGIIERKHFFRVEISAIVFKRGIEKLYYEVPVTVQCAAVPASHIDRRGTMSSMASASSSNLRYLSPPPSEISSNLRSSRSLGHFPSPPVNTVPQSRTFDASPPQSPTADSPLVRMNSKTWRSDELPGLPVAGPSTSSPLSAPQLASPVKLGPRKRKNWTLVKPGIGALEQLGAPTPPPTCPIPDVPVQQAGGVAPMIPPRSSSRLASARQAAPMKRSESTDSGRRGSNDTNSTVSVNSSPSDYSSRESSASSATSVSSSPSEAWPLKSRGALNLRKVDEMDSGEAFRYEFDTTIYQRTGKEDERKEFQRRIDLALSEVEKLALEESDVEGEEDGEGVLTPALRV